MTRIAGMIMSMCTDRQKTGFQFIIGCNHPNARYLDLRVLSVVSVGIYIIDGGVGTHCMASMVPMAALTT